MLAETIQLALMLADTIQLTPLLSKHRPFLITYAKRMRVGKEGKKGIVLGWIKMSAISGILEYLKFKNIWNFRNL